MTFDRDAVNTVRDDAAEEAERIIKEESAQQHKVEDAAKVAKTAEKDGKEAEALAAHEDAKAK